MEIWKPIEGYEGQYEVSNAGNVRNSKTMNILSKQSSGNGYYKVRLSLSGKVKGDWIHRLVAKAFVPNPNGFPVVDHKDGNKRNNDASNLEWVTQAENSNRAWKMGLTPKAPIAFGENHHNHVLSYDQVEEIRMLYRLTKTSQRKLARLFGVSQTTIKCIVNGSAWKENLDDALRNRSSNPQHC